MPGWRREAEALIAEALGAPALPWIELDAVLPVPGAAIPRLVLSMVGHRAPAADRLRVLARIGEMLAADGTLVVVDHNRPRRSLDAVAAMLGAPHVPGLQPAMRWRRLAHPTAREVQSAGFRVDRLRFAAGERLQIVIAQRVRHPRAPNCGARG